MSKNIRILKNMNTCIRKGEFPNKLKTADITPAFKKGDKHLTSKYTTNIVKSL